MPNVKLGGALLVSLLLSACGPVQKLEQRAAFTIGAVPLTIDKGLSDEWSTFSGGLPPSLQAPSKRDYLGFIASTSESRCADFLNGLVVAANGTHTGLDMITTVFSALGTAFTPLAVVHAMTAAATISSGWKTAIDADIFARQTVYSLVQAIQSTYYKDIGNYVDALAKKNDTDISLTAEITKIQTIHGECSLASAQGTVLASVTTTAQASGTLSEVLTVSGTAGAADTLVLTVGSSTIPAIPSIQIPVTPGETPAQIASALAAGVNGLSLNGVSATVGSNLTSVALTWPASAGMIWTPSMKHGARSGLLITPTQPVSADTQAGQPGKAVAK